MRHSLAPVVLCLLAPCLVGCDSMADRISADPQDLLSLTITPSTIPADGASVTTVEARVSTGSLTEDRFVTFSTSAGTFVTDTSLPTDNIAVEADVDGRATVQLTSPLRVCSGIVRAKAGSHVREARVSFTAAPPEWIEVTADRYVVQVTLWDTTAVFATLRRANGVATPGTLVDFSAWSPQEEPVGGFASVTASDSTGIASAVYSAGETSYRGLVTIRAAVLDPTSGTVVQGETTVQLVD